MIDIKNSDSVFFALKCPFERNSTRHATLETDATLYEPTPANATEPKKGIVK